MLADAIVVLGCRVLPSGALTQAAARRAMTAAKAWHDGIAPVVVASGGRRWGLVVEARALERALLRAGVPRTAIVRELGSLTTHENAVYTEALLRRLAPGKPPRAALVTCSWHMRRAARDFAHAGVDAIPVPAECGPVDRWTGLSRAVRERLSGLLDDHMLTRSSVLRDSVAAAFGAPEAS